MQKDNDKNIKSYSRDIIKYPLLEPKREQELYDIILNSKDKKKLDKAREELVVSNLRLVIYMAGKVYQKFISLDEANTSLMDLIQAGNIGLMNAAKLFDPKKGAKFSSYAGAAIQEAMTTEIKLSKFIHIPVKYFKYFHVIDEFENIHGKDNVKELGEELGFSEKITLALSQGRFSKAGLGEVDFDNECIEDNIGQSDTIIDGKQLKEYLIKKIKSLSDKEKRVVLSVYLDEKSLTISELARKLGTSRQSVQQTLKRSLRKLKLKVTNDVAKNKIDINIKKEKLMRAKFNIVRTVKNSSNTMHKTNCLECASVFGISEKVLESVSKDNFKPTCPSCGGKKCKIETGVLLTYGYLKTECPKCKNVFGLETKKIEKMSEVGIRYSCPCCGYDAGINE